MQPVVAQSGRDLQRIQNLPVVVSVNAEALQVGGRLPVVRREDRREQSVIQPGCGVRLTGLKARAGDERSRLVLPDVLQFERVGFQVAPIGLGELIERKGREVEDLAVVGPNEHQNVRRRVGERELVV